MKLPNWLLRLLPMWDYICPKCKKEVAKNSHRCVHCGERYGQPVRVPPKFLKDPKVLEAYVHKHVFPRVSKVQRDYLTQFFTTLFSDGFESNDFSAWTTGTLQSGATISVVSEQSHHGTYSAKGSGLDATNEYVMARKSISEVATLFMRGYIRFTQHFNNSTHIASLLHFEKTTVAHIAVDLERQADGTYRWKVNRQNDPAGADDYYSSPFSLTLNSWYCVELKAVVHSSAGELKLWVDESLVVNETSLNTGTSNIDEVRIEAFQDGQNPNVGTLYWDCVVVADAYIGPEAEAGQQPFTLINEMGY